jgi:hypothetical protein
MTKTFSDCSDGLRRLLLSLEPPEVNYIPPANRKDVIRNVHDAMLGKGYPVSMSQAEEIWSAYSHNNYSLWLVGGETLESALSAVIDLCNDIENGENHICL